METKETILAKLNTSPDRLTELVEQDGFYTLCGKKLRGSSIRS